MNPFLLRSNDKNYYVTYSIIMSGLILSILLVYIFTKPTDTIQIPGQPVRPYWPYYIDDNGNNTPRRIIDTVSPGPNSDVMVLDNGLSHTYHMVSSTSLYYISSKLYSRRHTTSTCHLPLY